MKIVSLKPALLGALLTAVALPAQAVSVYTDPVGAVAMEVPSGISVVSDVFIQPILYQGPVTEVSGVEIGLESVPSLNEAAFLHVVSGAAAGKVSSIVASGGSSVTVENAIGLSEGDVVAIRNHQTVGSFLEGAEFSDGDTLTLYNLDGSTETLTYFAGFGWFDSGFVSGEDFVIFPGEAIVLNTTAGFSLISLGAVTVHPVTVEFGANNVAFLGSINPTSEAAIGDIFAGSVTGGDTVTVYQNVAGSFGVAGSYTFFEGFGFYNDSFEPADSVGIPVGEGVALISGQAGTVNLPPAFVAEN